MWDFKSDPYDFVEPSLLLEEQNNHASAIIVNDWLADILFIC